jgi:hypothetical protein
MGFFLIRALPIWIEKEEHNGTNAKSILLSGPVQKILKYVCGFYARPMAISSERRFKTMPSPETGVIKVFTLDFGATRLIFLSSCDLW